MMKSLRKALNQLGSADESKLCAMVPERLNANLQAPALPSSHTADRYAQFFVFSIESQHISKCNLTIKSFED